MRIYARMEPAHYADYVDMGTDATVDCGGTTPTDLPETDPAGVLADTEAAVAAIDAEATQRAKAARAATHPDAVSTSTSCKPWWS